MLIGCICWVFIVIIMKNERNVIKMNLEVKYKYFSYCFFFVVVVLIIKNIDVLIYSYIKSCINVVLNNILYSMN